MRFTPSTIADVRAVYNPRGRGGRSRGGQGGSRRGRRKLTTEQLYSICVSKHGQEDLRCKALQAEMASTSVQTLGALALTNPKLLLKAKKRAKKLRKRMRKIRRASLKRRLARTGGGRRGAATRTASTKTATRRSTKTATRRSAAPHRYPPQHPGRPSGQAAQRPSRPRMEGRPGDPGSDQERPGRGRGRGRGRPGSQDRDFPQKGRKRALQVEQQDFSQLSAQYDELAGLVFGNVGVDYAGVALVNARHIFRAAQGGKKVPVKRLAKQYSRCVKRHGRADRKCQDLRRRRDMALVGKTGL